MRNRYLDLLRALAVVRVVVYHVTGWATMTLVFPAMSVMFALAGSLMAASLHRFGTAAVGRRLRRLLPSFWMLGAILVPAMLLTGLPFTPDLLLWLFPVADPPRNDWGIPVLGPIWYLRNYLWFVLASPLALWLFRRFPLPTLIAPYALTVAIELGLYPNPPMVVQQFGLYFGAWMVGFAHQAGMLRRLANRVLWPTAIVLVALGGWWNLTQPGTKGLDLNGNPLANALWSAGVILVVLGREPARTAWIDRNAIFSRLVTLTNRRALTVYLWHMAFVAALTPLVDVVGWSHQNLLGLAIRVVLVFALLGVVILLVGWVEDIAARRRPELIPGFGRRAAATPAGATATSEGAAVTSEEATAMSEGAAAPPEGAAEQTAAASADQAGTARKQPTVPAPRSAEYERVQTGSVESNAR
ncbi:acyltransferase family protein [Salinispora cortesiana]|uniref:acyltransferase family protein n=1 Tax=Salinispora cortesiana TaxID=1305843 RepID=UPI00040AA207|nr:acyltransferase [Salinispora cortesiana]